MHEIRAINRREVKRHERLWVSTPARAVLELAATGTTDEVTRAIDEGLAHRLFAPNELRAVLASNRPCRGAARLDAILGDETATALSRSRKKKRLLRGLRDARLPMPETNVKFGRFEADFLSRREQLVVEVDGYPFRRGDHVEKQLTMVLARIAGELARRAVAD